MSSSPPPPPSPKPDKLVGTVVPLNKVSAPGEAQLYEVVSESGCPTLDPFRYVKVYKVVRNITLQEQLDQNLLGYTCKYSYSYNSQSGPSGLQVGDEFETNCGTFPLPTGPSPPVGTTFKARFRVESINN